MKLIRWVEEHLTGRSKRNKDNLAERGSHHRQVPGLFYDQSLLPLHLKLDSSCPLVGGRSGRTGHTNRHFEVKGECEREAASLAAARPEPYDTIALSSRDNGNWMVNNSYPSLEASNPLCHSQYSRSGHPSTSTLGDRAAHRQWYANDTAYYSNRQSANNANCLLERDEEYLTVYFSVDDNSPSIDTSTVRHSHQPFQTNSRVNHGVNNPSIHERLSILRRSNQQQQSMNADKLYCGRKSAVIECHNAISGGNQEMRKFTRQDHNRHSHQSYFTSSQVNNVVHYDEVYYHLLATLNSLTDSRVPLTPSTARRYSERSRIKTNPWLKSPWTTPQKRPDNQPCAMSSSSVSGSNGNSSDSGCSLIPSNALAMTSDSRATIDNCNTCENTGHSSLGVISALSSNFNSNNTSPITDKESISHCISEIESTQLEEPIIKSASSRRNANHGETVNCDVNKNRLSNMRSDKILRNNVLSCVPVSDDISSDSLSGNNDSSSKHNSNSYNVSNIGVRCRNKGAGGNNTLTCSYFQGQTCVIPTKNASSSTITSNNTSVSGSSGRRRRRKSRVQGIHSANRVSSLHSVSASHCNGFSLPSSSPSSSSSKCSPPANEPVIRSKVNSSVNHVSTSSARVTSAASVKRRKGKHVRSALCPSASSESLSALPAPPDCVSSQLILQDLLSDLVTRAKSSSSSSSSSSTSKQCTSSSQSSETTPVEGRKVCLSDNRPYSWTYSSGKMNERMRSKVQETEEKMRRCNRNDITTIGDDDDSQVNEVNEATARQEGSCIFSDVTLSPPPQRDATCAGNSRKQEATSDASGECKCISSSTSMDSDKSGPQATERRVGLLPLQGASLNTGASRHALSLCRESLESPRAAGTLKAHGTGPLDASRNWTVWRRRETQDVDSCDGKEEEDCLPAGSIDGPTVNANSCNVKLRRSVKSGAIVSMKESRQSAPVLIDSESCKPLDSVSPMASSLMVMNSPSLAESPANMTSSVLNGGSNDCFTITPSSSRGSSVSFSRSSSVSSSRPGSLVSASAALSAAGRRYYSSLLNKRRFVASGPLDHMNHHPSLVDKANNSLLKRFSLLSNEEWVSTATEELICSDDEEATEYESESSQLDASAATGDSVTRVTSGDIHCINTRERDDIKSTYGERSNVTIGEKVAPREGINYQSNSSSSASDARVSTRSKSIRSTVTSISMTHDTEMSQCGASKIQADEEERTIAAVTASAVSRRRRERASHCEEETKTGVCGGVGRHIRPQVDSSHFNCSISRPSPMLSTASSPLCPVDNCNAGERHGDYLSLIERERKSDSNCAASSSYSSLAVSALGKEDIHTRRIFEARHLREMRKETKATLMQVNENIDSTFSPLQQLKLVSERLEHLLKMEDQVNSSDHVLDHAPATSTQRVHICQEVSSIHKDRSNTPLEVPLADAADETRQSNNPRKACNSSRATPTAEGCSPSGQTGHLVTTRPSPAPLANSQRCDSSFTSSSSPSSSPSCCSSSACSSCSSSSSCPNATNRSLEGKASLDTNVKLTHIIRSVDATDSPFNATKASVDSHFSTLPNHIKLTPSSCEVKAKPSHTKRPISSSSTSHFDRRVRRTMEHEKLWQDISTRCSFNESNFSLLNSFIQSSSQHANSVSAVHSHSSSPSPSSSTCASFPSAGRVRGE